MLAKIHIFTCVLQKKVPKTIDMLQQGYWKWSQRKTLRSSKEELFEWHHIVLSQFLWFLHFTQQPLVAQESLFLLLYSLHASICSDKGYMSHMATKVDKQEHKNQMVLDILPINTLVIPKEVQEENLYRLKFRSSRCVTLFHFFLHQQSPLP